jgi:hypothetical protein
MRLYVEELQGSTLVQTFTRTKEASIPFVRLHLCKYLAPAGTFTVTLTDASDAVIATSSQTLAQMQASGNADLSANYYHGYVKFDFGAAYTLRPGTYKLKLSASGYTYSIGTFLGWVKADTDRAIPLTDGSSPTGVNCPYDFEMYAYERVR